MGRGLAAVEVAVEGDSAEAEVGDSVVAEEAGEAAEAGLTGGEDLETI